MCILGSRLEAVAVALCLWRRDEKYVPAHASGTATDQTPAAADRSHTLSTPRALPKSSSVAFPPNSDSRCSCESG